MRVYVFMYVCKKLCAHVDVYEIMHVLCVCK